MDYEFIIDLVQGGELDSMLDSLIEASVARRTFLRDVRGAQNKVAFVPGTRVRVVNIKPKYLSRITGVVSNRIADRRGDLMVDIDPQCYHRLGRYSKCLSIPASSLELV